MTTQEELDKQKPVTRLTWEETAKALDDLDVTGIDRIVAVARSGLVPATYIAKNSGLPLSVLYTSDDTLARASNEILREYLDGSGETVLVIDDIISSGRTVDFVRGLLAESADAPARILFFALYVDYTTPNAADAMERAPTIGFIPSVLSDTYCGHWIGFCWEQDKMVRPGFRGLLRETYSPAKDSKVKITVFCALRFEAQHHWPEAPNEVAFLRVLHRHEFHVKLWFAVSHDDRDIEFILAKRKAQKHIAEVLETKDTNRWSCEQWAKELITGLGAIQAEVSEDGENGALVTA